MSFPTDQIPELLWEPDTDAWSTTRVGRFLTELGRQNGVLFEEYEDAWEWSVENLEPFWDAVWEHFEVIGDRGDGPVLDDPSMPAPAWFPTARLNYAENALARDDVDDSHTAIISRSQTRDGDEELTYGELRDGVARCAEGLRRLGVGEGDRVAGYLPNVPEAVVAFLATASLGAVWSSCAPEFGVRSVVDRLSQVDPRVLITIDGYRYGDKEVDRTEEVAEIRDALEALEHTVVLPYLGDGTGIDDAVVWQDLLAEPAKPAYTRVHFDDPLYVLYSSGTTGLPKPITHGHGGIVLEHLKAIGLHGDLGPEDRFFWFSTTGWMMWNYLVSGLLVGGTIVLFDGDPGHPDLSTLWKLAADTDTTFFGVSAPFLMSCRKAGLTPGEDFDLSAVHGVGSTGAPLPPEGFEWVYEAVHDDLILASVSGGTDVCTAFVGAVPLKPVRAGEIPCRFLGAKVEAYDSNGEPVIGEQGELVITAPMPSMPVFFWGDLDGSRYEDAYFDMFPGVWRHGDWITITERGTCVITGRSDATLNRGGVRLGTSEFYSVVDADEAVEDSLVVHLEDSEGGLGELLLFVAPTRNREVDDELRTRLTGALREQLSPRHVPDEIVGVREIPRTLSGKRCEIPVKRILRGTSVDKAVSKGALANPESIAEYERYARERT